MIDHEDVRQLYEYNRWANARTLDAVAALTAEQFTQDLSNSFGSVRNTLVHILAAEWVWLRRWQGTSPRAFLEPQEFPDLAALRRRWHEIECEQTGFVNSVSDAALAQVLSYTNMQGEVWRYPLRQMMQHVVNHSTYHRGQVATLMRQLGAQSFPTDFLAFFDE
jgi:uncharacterized damage-inducible protein DinB